MNKKVMLLILIVLVLLGLDQRLKVVNYTIDESRIQIKVKIALITDLHGCYYGENQEKLIEKINNYQPDLVLLGGDIYDLNSHKNITDVLEAIQDYKSYYVSGNHEVWSGKLEEFKNELSNYGVKILEGTYDQVRINGQEIQIAGINDPALNDRKLLKKELDQLKGISKRAYTILLAHRPELIDLYQTYDFDLVLAGHAHGGQWRIPLLLNGLFAPNQGLFPKYAGGYYKDEKLVVSRGLARESTRVPRIFNRPELVLIELE